jgi:hypothetical protein
MVEIVFDINSMGGIFYVYLYETAEHVCGMRQHGHEHGSSSDQQHSLLDTQGAIVKVNSDT